MLGPGLHFNRSSRNAEDRFSSGAKARLAQDYFRRSQSEPLPDKSNAEIPASEPSPLCNLERFLESVTPSLPAQYVSKMKARSWRTCNVVESKPFFVLSDLWESFKEWSAYGAGVPLVLNDRDGVVQYYVPYLSGIQLYADISKSTTKLRRRGEESDGEYFRDSSSDGSSDSEQERCGLSYSREQPSYFKSSNSPLTVDQMAVREHQRAFQEGFSSDEGEPEISQGCLLFEYLEHAPPYSREPLATKISDLALNCPELKTLRSCDLLPSSWISVAWYPIYRIPTGPTLRDLDACFLTFHSLHTPVTGSEVVHPPVVTYPSEGDGAPQISLPVFGLASYKYKASLWTPFTGHQLQLENSLLQAADNWLNLLRVNHPDFSFFCRR